MSGNDELHAPIIIKKKKVMAAGHHGGAWKIALADMMTALFATFLVLWLVSGSSPSTLQGITEYFNTPLKIAMVGGEQSAMSSSIIPGGGADPMEIEGQKIKVSDKQSIRTSEVQSSFFEMMKKVKETIRKDPELSKLSDQVRFDITEEGLLIEFVDSDNLPMFDLGSDELAPYMTKVLQIIAPLVDEVGHMLTITGHTDSIGFSAGETRYSNWELSSDRANASRRTLVSGGMRPTLINTVIGMSDREPAVASDRNDPTNRRIEILIHNDLIAPK